MQQGGVARSGSISIRSSAAADEQLDAYDLRIRNHLQSSMRVVTFAKVWKVRSSPLTRQPSFVFYVLFCNGLCGAG